MIMMSDSTEFLDYTVVNASLSNNSYADLNVNETVFSIYPPALLDFAAACCIVFAVFGVTGNIISIVALCRCPKLHNATTAFIVNLCAADFLFCAFSLPLSAVLFLEREWKHGDVLCRLFPLIRYANGAVSIFSVIAITFNRYVLIVHPKRYEKIYTPVKIAFMIILQWISALLLFSLPLFELWGRFGYDLAVGTCSILKLNGKSPKTYLYAVAFVLPSIVFVICYSRIYYAVRKSARKFRKNLENKTRTSAGISFAASKWVFSRKLRHSHGDCSDAFSFTGSQKKDKKELRVLRVMLVIFITFVLCYFPVSFVKILKKEDTLPFLNIFGYLAVYFSNCINPVIYVVMSKEYRKAYAMLFGCHSKNQKNCRKKCRERPFRLTDVPADSFKYIEVRLPHE